MKFFDRTKELEILRRIRDDSIQTARFTVLTGRRRIGKTELLKRAFASELFLYFFVARRSEAELCEIFAQEIFAKLGVAVPGRSTRAQIENALQIEIGGFLKNLTDEYELISRRQPLFDKPRSKNVAYQISDNFYTFWFRFIAHHSYMIEIGVNDQLKDLVKRDYDAFSGKMQERLFAAKLAESGRWTRIASWWDRKGENEIDLIAENELEKEVCFFEVKRDPSRYSAAKLAAKVEAFNRATGGFANFRTNCHCLSLEDLAR